MVSFIKSCQTCPNWFLHAEAFFPRTKVFPWDNGTRKWLWHPSEVKALTGESLVLRLNVNVELLFSIQSIFVCPHPCLDNPLKQGHSLFCSTSLPLARGLDGFDQCYQASAVHCSRQQRRRLTSATSRLKKNYWDNQESNLGLLGAKREYYPLSYTPPPPPPIRLAFWVRYRNGCPNQAK